MELSEKPVDSESLLLILQGLASALEDISGQVDKLNAQVFSSTTGAISSSSNITWLGTPALVVNGTTTAHVSPVTVSIASYVPATATGVIFATDLKQTGGSSMKLTLYTPGGASGVIVNEFIAPGGQEVHTAGGGGIAITNQNLLYTITDYLDGSSNTGWGWYKIYITGYTS